MSTQPLTSEAALTALLDAGRGFAAAARRSDPDAAVPPCPGWSVRDLVVHLGGVHRWVHGFVSTGRTEPTTREERAAFGAHPGDEHLLDWWDEGFGQVTDALARAEASLRCWTLLPAGSGRDFWARRMAHETLVHRLDAEIAAGDEPGAVPTELAADGIAEITEDFLPVLAPRRLVGRAPRTLGVVADDADRAWTVRLDPDDPGATSADTVAPDVELTLRGGAGPLHRMLWNRGGDDAVEAAGDAEVLDAWRTAARV